MRELVTYRVDLLFKEKTFEGGEDMPDQYRKMAIVVPGYSCREVKKWIEKLIFEWPGQPDIVRIKELSYTQLKIEFPCKKSRD